MIVYFTGTGNSLAISKQIASATGDTITPMSKACQMDLSNEQCVGLVYPCYDFCTPPAVRDMVSQMNINPKAYVYIVITCGAQACNSIWTVRSILKQKGVSVAYCHKIRVPDNSAILFGRDPNSQLWKFDKFAPRLGQIVDDVKARRHARHFGSFGIIGWVMGRPAIERKLLGGFRPAVNAGMCVSCGICASVCPIGNIAMQEKASIGDHCSSCLACLHACPQQAIQVGDKPTIKERQYRHPDIKLNELKSNVNNQQNSH